MKRPLGFTLLAIYLGLSAAGGFFQALTYDIAFPRGMSALPLVTAVFAGVAAEALWRCRPWCVRAFVAFGCVRLLEEASEPLISFVMLAFITAIVGGYVHNRAARLFAPQPARVPVPAPRP